VFTVIIHIFAGAVALAERTSYMNGEYCQAISLCQHKIDQLRAIGFGRLNYTEMRDAEVVDDSPSNSPYSFVQVDDVDDYLPNPTATVALETVSSKTIRVTVTITWNTHSYEAKTSSVTLQALIANVE